MHTILQELLKFGCSDLDFYLVTVDGYIWGIKDDLNDTVIRGYEMATETFDAFKDYATDTTVQKIMASWDLDNAEIEACSYAITSEELGYKATSLRGNISGYQTGVQTTADDFEVTVFAGFGSAGNRYDITGLLPANFSVYNVSQAIPVTLNTATEDPLNPGTYTLNVDGLQVDPTNIIRISATAQGYDIADVDITATL